jgi:hypothetical protein
MVHQLLCVDVYLMVLTCLHLQLHRPDTFIDMYKKPPSGNMTGRGREGIIIHERHERTIPTHGVGPLTGVAALVGPW